ncbi:competence/damage-inducible protein A [Methyloglobulus sp.]|uniref:competence/damage-inducible protein A n=1 Tax=Methyloglobulus sp. TaxID=2518622 RepID=UPI0039896276
MNPTFEIFSQGEEIVTGQVVDTNAAWLSEQAVAMGFNVTRHTAVGDKLEDLIQVLLDISNRADCCICTGGLGPTSDDLTAEAVAKAFDLPLVFDGIAFAQIQQFFNSRNRPMPECNRKQAMLPQSSIRLANHIGTAPGFALQNGRCWFAFIPGVPSEMRHLFLEHIQPMWVDRFVLRPSKLITIKTVGIGESDLQERINTIEIPPQVQIGFRAELGEVQTKLLFPGDYPQSQLENLTYSIAATIGDTVFAIEGLGHHSGDLVSVVDQLMTAGGHTLAVVEIVSQGLLAAKLIGVSWLLSAVYEQSVERLTQRLAINNLDDLITTSKAIAKAVQKNTGADMVLIQLTSRDYYINPNNDKAVTVTSTLLVNSECNQTVRTIAGDIKRKQHQAALLSLDLLRRCLQGKEIV